MQILTTAIQTLKKHGFQRVARTCIDMVQAHGVFSGTRLIIRSLATRRMVGGVAALPSPRPAKPAACRTSGCQLFDNTVLVVAAMDLPQCKKYRVIQREEMLTRCGGLTVVHSEYRDVLRWRSLLQIAGVVYAYRIPDGAEWQQLLDECDRVGVDVIYDIDDPVFDLETVTSNPNLLTLSPSIRRHLEADATLFIQAMNRASRVCVSTRGLARLVSHVLPDTPVHVVPNGVDSESWLYATMPTSPFTLAGTGHRKRNILVSSGSMAHDADFDVCREGLRKLLEMRDDVVLTVCGHADVGDICEPSRLTKYPLLPYSEYLRVVATADVTLIPLADCPFNEGKSCVRFLDAAVNSTAVIASDVGEYRELVARGVCVGVQGPDGWYDALCELLDSAERREELATEAYRYVVEQRSLATIWNHLDRPLREAVGGAIQAATDSPTPIQSRDEPPRATHCDTLGDACVL
jgi:glycosyltransferase involved in cell wall biosynthesis